MNFTKTPLTQFGELLLGLSREEADLLLFRLDRRGPNGLFASSLTDEIRALGKDPKKCKTYQAYYRANERLFLKGICKTVLQKIPGYTNLALRQLLPNDNPLYDQHLRFGDMTTIPIIGPDGERKGWLPKKIVKRLYIEMTPTDGNFQHPCVKRYPKKPRNDAKKEPSNIIGNKKGNIYRGELKNEKPKRNNKPPKPKRKLKKYTSIVHSAGD